MEIVKPKVYYVGTTEIKREGLHEYLKDTDQLEFLEEINVAKDQSLSSGEILTSFYAKSCYSALTVKKNKNISRIRGIKDNIQGTIKSGHGSVAEHVMLNFMISNCSRVMTHELVRHRAGTAFSQTSGRYVRTDVLNIVSDSILDPINDLVVEVGLYLEDWYKRACDKIQVNDITDFTTKKKITSALRRFLPNGQSNEIGFSCNYRALRHIIAMRTSRHAEAEIRDVFNQIYSLVKREHAVMFFDAKEEFVDGFLEITFENNKI